MQLSDFRILHHPQKKPITRRHCPRSAARSNLAATSARSIPRAAYSEHVRERMHTVCVAFCARLLSRCSLRLIHVGACLRTTPFCGQTTFHCVPCHISFTCLAVKGHLGCLHTLAVRRNAAVTIRVQACLCTCFHFAWTDTSGITRSYGNCFIF